MYTLTCIYDGYIHCPPCSETEDAVVCRLLNLTHASIILRAHPLHTNDCLHVSLLPIASSLGYVYWGQRKET